ncbi:MAG TPA: type I methionyl aminopeptidase [Ignavibacteriales bacterium]|nr:type I methionyl aminopeptidase [Ignavibacteriales bacterium]HOM64441.1 type I methionyl aminopeptidase [Ignavibacteriales bacterium]HPP32348.1 type I methionyl aminopeptidase [Ignavibacteriales bacterium]HRR17681.1 type I methionyl aminopeptidase [Ignavibacteriales bacterium]
MIIIKSKKDIEFIKKSCKLLSSLFKILQKNVVEGVTPLELDKIAESFIKENNIKSAFKGYKVYGLPPYPANLCISVNEVVVHGIPDNRVIKSGDIVSIDAGLIVDGYYSDMAKTFIVGEVTEKVKKLVEVTKESLYIGIEQATEGNRIGDISAAIQNHVEKHGFSVVKALTGHGVGKYLHEDPQIPNYGIPGTGTKLKNGMTLAIEPMVNIGTDEVITGSDGWTVLSADYSYSAHFEHTILINGNKPEILTEE